MATDTSRTLQIAGSPAKLLALAAMGMVMTAASAAVAVPLIGLPGWIARIVGWFGAFFFGACTIVAIWRLSKAREPVLTISPRGICDTRLAREVIPWSAVTSISTWEYRNQKALVLAVNPATEARLPLSQIARWTRSANRALGADGLCVTAAGLKIDFPTLLRICQDYAKAAHERH